MHGFLNRFKHRLGYRSRSTDEQFTLAHMQNGQSAKVVEIHGGQRLTSRLNALGVRPGKRVTKVGGMFMRGPITVRLGGTQVAIGFGMARRITVKPDKG